MSELSLSGTLLEKDVRRNADYNMPPERVRPLEDVIEEARAEIAAVFAKQRERAMVTAR
ncbi:hypothetical protein [Thioclava sp. F36-6]|uniref:hypothetical protein n=1 Tax=Thioclava sp. F36-6 TaxID=1915316 RepID=UPI001438D300|nr:hypothetical protein [Thioclava sp. F36-6]